MAASQPPRELKDLLTLRLVRARRSHHEQKLQARSSFRRSTEPLSQTEVRVLSRSRRCAGFLRPALSPAAPPGASRACPQEIKMRGVSPSWKTPLKRSPSPLEAGQSPLSEQLLHLVLLSLLSTNLILTCVAVHAIRVLHVYAERPSAHRAYARSPVLRHNAPPFVVCKWGRRRDSNPHFPPSPSCWHAVGHYPGYCTCAAHRESRTPVAKATLPL